MFPIYISPNGHLASCSKYIMQLLVCLINHNKTWHGSEAFHFQQLRDHCGLYPRTPLSTTLVGCDSTVVREYIPWGLAELMHGHQPQSPASICSFPVFSVLAVLASSERSPSRSSSNRPLILILKTALTFFFLLLLYCHNSPSFYDGLEPKLNSIVKIRLLWENLNRTVFFIVQPSPLTSHSLRDEIQATGAHEPSKRADHSGLSAHFTLQ